MKNALLRTKEGIVWVFYHSQAKYVMMGMSKVHLIIFIGQIG